MRREEKNIRNKKQKNTGREEKNEQKSEDMIYEHDIATWITKC